MKKHNVFTNLLETQKANRELIVSSVLLAVGVNLLSTGIAELAGEQYRAWMLTLVGTLICIGVVCWNVFFKLHSADKKIEVEGFVIYNEKTHELIGVPEYSISTDMVSYLRSACAENKAIEKIWDRGTINKFAVLHNQNNEGEGLDNSYSVELFVELLEYCIIHKLSLHLSSFFNSHSECSEVKELSGGDVPDVLLKNRFLKLFSEDMANRAVFVCEDRPLEKNKTGTVVMAYNSTGAMYSRFYLTLPKGSTVLRKNKNELLIDTPVLSMSIEIIYDGFSTVLKPGFERYYVGLKGNPMEHRTYKFAIKVGVKFKPKVLFSKEKECYYAWVDSFMDELEKYASKEQFFHTINWDEVHCLLRSISITKRRQAEGTVEKPHISYTIVEEEVEE